MTVSTTDSAIEYVSGGPAFPIPYRFLQNSDIQAVLVKQDGTSETLVLGTQYTLSGAGTQSGGTLTSSYAAGYLATPGAILTISRVMDAVQPTDLRNQGRFLAETHETVFDRLTMLVQQGFSILRRALLRPIGKNYYDAEGRQIKNLSDGAADQDAVNVRTMRNYVDAAVAGVIGGFGWFLQAGIGAVYRTFQAKMRDAISTKDFGAKCNGVDDDTVATKNAIAEAAARGGWEVFIPGRSVIVGDLRVPEGVTFSSTGKGYEKRIVGGFILKGTGEKKYSIPGATAIAVANPDAGAAYLADSGTRGDTYSTVDLSVPFSAGLIFDGKNVAMRNMGVVPWFDGLSGYDGEDGRLSDETDVGIWARNASGWQLENVLVDGHFRKFGFLASSSDIGDGKIPQCELGHAINCWFGGFRGVGMRAPRDANGATNYGFAGTDFINCFIRSLNHQSAHLATSTFLAEPFASPSACLELDGSSVLRGVQFLNCTFMGRDDICIISDSCSEILFNGCYSESKSIKTFGAWLANSVGSRMVATANTVAHFFHSNTKYAVDLSPYFTKDSSLNSSRYDNSKNGVFSPATAQDSEWERPNFATSLGNRLRLNQVFRIYDYLFSSKFSVTQTGAVHTSDNITIDQNDAGLYSNTNPMVRRFASGTVQLANGAAALSDGTLTNPGIIRHTVDNSWSFGSPSFRGTVVYAATGSINTSHGVLKKVRGVLSEAELRAWSNVQAQVYQFLDAIELKGEDQARLHAGYIAEEVAQAFRDQGLDPRRYALWCEDPLYKTVTVVQRVAREKTVIAEETVSRIEIRDGIPVQVFDVVKVKKTVANPVGVINDDGSPAIGEDGGQIFHLVPVMEEVDEEIEVEVEDGTRLGLRYEQCLVFETAYNRSLVANLERRVSLLEDK
ncbi:tail fiber domain-containing protein [Pseudomonas sp. NBRC 111136]|uniref:tail fiber domain-containing protein n=1 Tax=Pseudomonas sp. NBRC 111136 TaxID=1661051 RepID=UPI000A7A56AF|nr:tail fiber domain-containing protein [Pseudomonas sp. NBRC 111136]